MAHQDTQARTMDNSQDVERAARPGRDRYLSEYGEIMADIARPPRPTLWERFTIALAGHGR